MKLLPWVLTGALGFVALLLWLNLRELDHYELGSLDPVDGSAEAAHDLARLVPPTIPHGDHAHALEVVEHHRELTLRDRDGWYRVFWSGDEIYHYKELVHLAADLQNATAVDPAGTWTMRLRAAAAPCGTSPLDTQVVYRLGVEEGLFPDALLPISVPALSYNCRAPHLPQNLSFGWVLAK